MSFAICNTIEYCSQPIWDMIFKSYKLDTQSKLSNEIKENCLLHPNHLLAGICYRQQKPVSVDFSWVLESTSELFHCLYLRLLKHHF